MSDISLITTVIFLLYSHPTVVSIEGRVSYRNSVAHYVAERNAIFTAISARFVAHIPHLFAPNLRLKVSFFLRINTAEF